MPKIVFWSPDANATGQTHACIAISSLMAIEEEYSNLVVHGHWKSKKIESAFTPYDMLKRMNIFNSSGVGITALSRLVESNKITAESIRNYAKPVLKQRLDIMYGTNVSSREQFVQLTKSLQKVIKNSTEAYDFVWIDLPKGVDKKYIIDILRDADFVICTINQDAILLEKTIFMT